MIRKKNKSSILHYLQPLMCFPNSSSILLFSPIITIFSEKAEDPLVEKEQWSTYRDIKLATSKTFWYTEALRQLDAGKRVKSRIWKLLGGFWGAVSVSWLFSWFCKIKSTSTGFSQRLLASWTSSFILNPNIKIKNQAVKTSFRTRTSILLQL